MTEVMHWNGAERRTGADRRTRFAEWLDDRRNEERRRGGIGTHHPDPVSVLLDGLDIPDTLAFEPVPAVGHVPMASPAAAIGSRLAPPHEAHDAIPSTAAILGHPLHPAVVPLPIGALTGALAADLAFAVTRDPFFARAGRLLTGAGLVTGALAGVLGAIDFAASGPVRSHKAAWFHAGGNVGTLLLGALSLGLRLRSSDERRGVLPGGLALSLVSALLLAVTGWLGGELAFRHRVGVTEQEDRV